MKDKEYLVRAIINTVNSRGYITIPSVGASMFPVIKQGDICKFTKCELQYVKRGDILLFSLSNNKLVAHRFIRKEGNTYILKGDTNLGYDSPVTPEQIIGKLVEINRGKKVININTLLLKSWGYIIQRIPILWDILRNYTNKQVM